MFAEVFGKHGIRAKVIAYSISPSGQRLVTLEAEYPRMVLAELNTHRMLSRNSSSSRAIPFEKMLKQLTARPVRFGQANPGMQDKGTDFDAAVNFEMLSDEDGYAEARCELPAEAWNCAKKTAVEFAQAFYKAGYHKQVYNRLVEPFQMMKTVISGTELANLIWLRDDDAADPSLRELVKCIREAVEQSHPIALHPGEWHLPYVITEREDDGEVSYKIEDEVGGGIVRAQYLTLEEAITVSSARSAAISFRNVDYGLEKSKEVYTRLVGDIRKHGSAMEHQATPMVEDAWGVNSLGMSSTWEKGVSHVDRDGKLWSGNFCGWIQHRKLIEGENVPGFMLEKK